MAKTVTLPGLHPDAEAASFEAAYAEAARRNLSTLRGAMTALWATSCGIAFLDPDEHQWGIGDVVFLGRDGQPIAVDLEASRMAVAGAYGPEGGWRVRDLEGSLDNLLASLTHEIMAAAGAETGIWDGVPQGQGMRMTGSIRVGIGGVQLCVEAAHIGSVELSLTDEEATRVVPRQPDGDSPSP